MGAVLTEFKVQSYFNIGILHLTAGNGLGTGWA